jgi:hypothetical protein
MISGKIRNITRPRTAKTVPIKLLLLINKTSINRISRILIIDIQIIKTNSNKIKYVIFAGLFVSSTIENIGSPR